ncbi:unknown protein [Seminavis robusta]|uniref:Uncharacterized protein n=1 Tax=Seminavis robusta TaxID=568900 RepID=A0A9N8HXZ6_9STRA|nr:unknown protein [Seminavis robusta]|eukprot:Sro2352_g324430.1 n/a (470) ;mRNA; r:9158-10567
MPTQQRARRGPKWTQQHPDTGISLKYIHENPDSNHTEFKATAQGQVLVDKWTAAKVDHNFKQTKKQYLIDIHPSTRGQGGFSPQVRAIAGLSIPENAAAAAPPLVPGDDGEDLGAQDDILGGTLDEDDGFEEEEEVADTTAPPTPTPTPTPPPTPPSGNNMSFYTRHYVNDSMVDNNRGVVSTLYVARFDPPSGVTTVEATLREDMKTIDFRFMEPNGAHNGDVVGQQLDQPLRNTINRAEEDEIRDGDYEEINGTIWAKATVALPEAVEPYLVSPRIVDFGSLQNPVCYTTIPRTMRLMTTVGAWSKRNKHIKARDAFVPVSVEEAQRTATLFGLATPPPPNTRVPAPAPDPMLAQLLHRLNQQEAQVNQMRRQHEQELAMQRQQFNTTTQQLDEQYKRATNARDEHVQANSPAAYQYFRENFNTMSEEDFRNLMQRMSMAAARGSSSPSSSPSWHRNQAFPCFHSFG